MKTRLLKPPSKHGEILFLPAVETFARTLQRGGMLSTCHQLQFFHPGIALRFHLVDLVQREEKCVIFMDTDRTDLRVRIPYLGGTLDLGRGQEAAAVSQVFDFIVSEKPLYTISSLQSGNVQRFFDEVSCHLESSAANSECGCVQEFQRFRELFIGQDPVVPLRERLAEAFISWNGIKTPYLFLSELLAGQQYKEFMGCIFRESERFRTVYNQSIDAFANHFRFRFKSYPFPQLKEGELPFWIIRDNVRHQLNTRDMDISDVKRYTVVPKASPLTLFLRLHKAEIFLHGVGGANYEWINDRILEHFYHEQRGPFFVTSATFHLCSVPERDYPYFFLNPALLRNRLRRYFKNQGSTVIV